MRASQNAIIAQRAPKPQASPLPAPVTKNCKICHNPVTIPSNAFGRNGHEESFADRPWRALPFRFGHGRAGTRDHHRPCPDPLAVAAIQQGDLARAEAILSDSRLDADDPVRLINLGDVYWLSGRQSEAVAAWRRALASRDQYDVETVGGRVLPTYEIAREALAAHGRPLQTASR